ncbi:MAG: TfoX/Sxy family protein [Alphaproteobacteria bacterium]
MAVSAGYKAFIEDILTPLGPVRIRSMFGGAGVYADLADGPVMFALIADETLYLKVDDGNRAAFEEAGMQPFTYEGKDGKRGVMSYYRCPDDLLEEPGALKQWAMDALDAALRSGIRKKKVRKKTKPDG